MEAFATFDAHNGGFMASEELLHIMKNLGEGLSDAVLAKVQEASEPDNEGQVRSFSLVPCFHSYSLTPG